MSVFYVEGCRDRLPSKDEPALCPNILTGICQNHEITFLRGSVAKENVRNQELQRKPRAYLRGTSVAHEFSFKPSGSSRMEGFADLATVPSGSVGTWLIMIWE